MCNKKCDIPFLETGFLGDGVTGLLIGSTKGTALQGSKKPDFPVIETPFHIPFTGGFSGLRNKTNKLLFIVFI